MSAVIGKSERSPSFVSILDAASENERWALEALAAECLPSLISFARLRGSTDPDGIAAIVMMELFSRLPDLDFEAPSQMWAYVYRIARSRIIDERRATKPVDVIDVHSLDTISDDGVDVDDEVVNRHYVDVLLSSLTSDQREVLEMRFLDDLTIAETASRTGRTTSAVKGLQRRAINALSAVVAVALLIGLAVLLFQEQNQATVISVEPADNGEAESPAVEAENSGGEQGGRTLSVDAVDTGAPETSITSAPEVATIETSAAFEFTGSDEMSDVDRFDCRLDGGRYFDCASPTEFGDLGVGGHVFEVRAVDSEGNADMTSAVHVWFVEPGSVQPGGQVDRLGESGSADENSGQPDAASQPLQLVAFNCGPVSGTRQEITELGYAVTIGTKGDDVIDLSSSSKPNFVLTGDGNDTIITGSGDDVVCGEGGNDTIESGGGKDHLHGGAGNDSILAGPGDDFVSAGGGNDSIHGGDGADRLHGGWGSDVIDGHKGADRLFGGDGYDVLIGGGDEDVCDTGKHGAELQETCTLPPVIPDSDKP